MKEVIKNNYKILVGVLIGFVISVSCVYAAATIIEGSEVEYDNSTSQGDGTTVQDAIDELYASVGFSKDVWKDETLNGADPVLTGDLKPVVISSDGKTYYANNHTKWYDYSQKRWANAVILVDEPSKEYSPGEKIEDDDIESYFVWIPRYKYKVWDDGKYEGLIEVKDLVNTKEGASGDKAFHKIAGDPQIIDIQFGDTSHVTGNSNEASVGNYLVHPAFKLGDKELNGIWVGKFETGYKDASSASDAAKDQKDASKIIVKPNVYSWRNITVKNAFESAYNYKAELKSHMMKNTEWGAVAYLSHSVYGIGGAINNNNNSDYKTGYSAAPGTDQNKYPGESAATSDSTKTLPWNTPTGHLASTTGNITGVYDMAGGAWEYMAAHIENNVGNSGFTDEELKNEKYKNYVDVYNANSTITSYNNRILGDATGELGPFFNYIEDNGTTYYHSSWYADSAYFVDSSYPWFGRGGYWDDGVLAGQFVFHGRAGVANTNSGFRLVLSPNSN